MKPQPRIVTASQISTYVHYLTEIDKAQQLLPSYSDGYVLAKDIFTELGKPAQSYVLIWLEEKGYIITLRGRTNRYRLARPLSSMRLVELVKLTDMPHTSPLVKLLMHNRRLTVADLCSVHCPSDLFDYPGTVYAFDFILSLADAMHHDWPLSQSEIQSALGEYSRSYTYTVGAIGMLAKQGLVERQPQRGYRLRHPFESLTIKDIIPTVSHRDTVFNKVMYLSRGLPLSLFV